MRLVINGWLTSFGAYIARMPYQTEVGMTLACAAFLGIHRQAAMALVSVGNHVFLKELVHHREYYLRYKCLWSDTVTRIEGDVFAISTIFEYVVKGHVTWLGRADVWEAALTTYSDMVLLR
jgi:hypothetical protein